MRFGLDDGEPKTLAQIADELGVSRERVRQLETVTITKLRAFADEQDKGENNDLNEDKADEERP
jgi:DNA-directed RNA polymerase sigma subunit (sigma70/sigma32)